MKFDEGFWGKSKQAKYMHYFDNGKITSLCNLSKNPNILSGDYPKCPICKQFLGIREHLVTNQTFKFKDKLSELTK